MVQYTCPPEMYTSGSVCVNPALESNSSTMDTGVTAGAGACPAGGAAAMGIANRKATQIRATLMESRRFMVGLRSSGTGRTGLAADRWAARAAPLARSLGPKAGSVKHRWIDCGLFDLPANAGGLTLLGVRDPGDLKNRSTALFVAILGTVIGVSGAIHGVYSILKGNTPTGGMLLPSIGAFTIVQNYLMTGILAVGFGMAVVVWTLVFIDRSYGPAVFVALSVALFLVGGGIAEIAFILLTALLSTRIHHPLGRWQRAAESRFGRALSRLWPYVITLAFSIFLIGYSIWLFVLPPGEVREIGTFHYVTWASLGIGFILLVLVIPCGFMRDIRERAKRDIPN